MGEPMTIHAHTIHAVPASAEGLRLDVFLLGIAPAGSTRGDVQRAIRKGHVTVDQKQLAKPGSILHDGQTVRVRGEAFHAPVPALVPDSSVELRILHEDPNLLVINKPAGLPVHAGVKREHPTLADALVARYPNLASVGEDPLRPGIVHRLDKDTSGVMLIARTPEMFQHLKQEFQARQVRKQYLAIVRGWMGDEEGTIKLPIIRSKRNPLRRTVARRKEGKPAETAFHVREHFTHYTLLDVYPQTGRMHQIRVHLSHLGFPIVGDQLYGKHVKDPDLPRVRRHLLHALSISVTLPSGKTHTFEAPLPDDMQEVLTRLRGLEHNRSPKEKSLSFRPWRPSHPSRKG